MRRAPALLAALLALVALSRPAVAGAAEPRASFNDIEDEVMCDTCNVPLNIAESPRADQQRREIRALIARGLTKEEVKAELKGRYGPGGPGPPRGRGLQPRRLPRADRGASSGSSRRWCCCCRAGGAGAGVRARTSPRHPS